MSSNELTVKDIVADWLQTHGFGGLYDGNECGCSIDDGLFVCDECPDQCHPGYLVEKTEACKSKCEGYEDCFNWCIRAEKPNAQ